jgi:hypothetical protein
MACRNTVKNRKFSLRLGFKKNLAQISQGFQGSKILGHHDDDDDDDDSCPLEAVKIDKTRDQDLITILNGLVEEILGDIKNKKAEFCMSLTAQSIPVLIISLVDYISDFFVQDKDGFWNIERDGDFRHNISKIKIDLMKLLAAIVGKNSLAKIQVFKGNGGNHLVNLIQKREISFFNFILGLVNDEANIPAFINNLIFQQLLTVYCDTLDRLV